MPGARCRQPSRRPRYRRQRCHRGTPARNRCRRRRRNWGPAGPRRRRTHRHLCRSPKQAPTGQLLSAPCAVGLSWQHYGAAAKYPRHHTRCSRTSVPCRTRQPRGCARAVPRSGPWAGAGSARPRPRSRSTLRSPVPSSPWPGCPPASGTCRATTPNPNAACSQARLLKAVREFDSHIRANAERMPTTGNATARVRPSPPHSPSPQSTRSSASAWSKNSRCAGHHAAHTCYCRSAPASPTTSSPATSAAGPRLRPGPGSHDARRVASPKLSRSPGRQRPASLNPWTAPDHNLQRTKPKLSQSAGPFMPERRR